MIRFNFCVMDLYNLVKSYATPEWDVDQEGDRVIITYKDLYKCFINRGFEVKSRKPVISAHMILFKDIGCSRLQYWNDSEVKKIAEDLNAIQMC